LQPTEHHDSARLAALVTEIAVSTIWTVPILSETRSLAVMDGHHRLATARPLGLRRIPVVRLGYDDPRLSLHSWRADRTYTPDDVLHAAESGRLLPIKSTRHVLSAALPRLEVPLDDLREVES